MNNFQNCLDYFHHQNLQQLIGNILPREKAVKRRNIDHDRTAYSILLNHTITQLQRYRLQGQKNRSIKSPSSIDRELISPVFSQLIQLLERQCNQKSLLVQIIFAFYKQSLLIMDLSSQDKIKKTLLQYFRNLQTQRKQSENQINLLKSQLYNIKEQNQKKWKTFYMIVKDNRVLRRQKGKLMRQLHQQKLKLCTIHQQMMQTAKQNEKYKLLANYQQSPESIALFLKNNLAISKLEYFMKKYPKQSKKILKNDLKKLQINQHFTLDEKIMYIIKTAKESEEILDEYQDLIDINEKPNKLIFNISTQTDLFDIGIDPPNQRISQLRTSKKLVRNFHSQTQQKHFHINSNIILISQVFKKVQSYLPKRRIALKTNAVEDIKIIEAIRHFTENVLSRRVYNFKIIGTKQKSRQQMSINSTIFSFNFMSSTKNHEFPQLPTSYKLDFDIRRSKQINRKELERRSSRKQNIHRSSAGCISVNLQEEPKTINQHKQKQQVKKQVDSSIQSNSQIKNTIKNTNTKKKLQKYKINPPQQKSNSKAKKDKIINKSTTYKGLNDSKNIDKSMSYSIQKLNKHRESVGKILAEKSSIKEVANLTQKPINISSNKNKKQEYSFQQYSNSHSNNPVISYNKNLSYPFQQQSKKAIRKSAFAAYKRINTVPNQTIQQQQLQWNNITQRKEEDQQQNQTKLANNMNIFNDLIDSNFTLTKDSFGNLHKNKKNKEKMVNIFQNHKIFQKIAKNMYLRRKQISKINDTFQSFLNSFLTAQYGVEKNVVISNSLKGNPNNIDCLLLEVFDVLLDHRLPIQYLSHLFKIFGKILLLNNCQILIISSTKKKYFEKQIFSLHFSEKRYNDYHKKTHQDNRQQFSICQIFLNLDYQLRKQMQTSQICHFLYQLLPHSQKYLTFDQVKQIFSLFIFEENYYEHLLALKKCCSPNISLQNFCFYAIREQWNPLVNIKNFIMQKYGKIQEALNQQEDHNDAEFSAKYNWTLMTIRQKQKNKHNKIHILGKYVSLLKINFLLNKHTPISALLTIIQNSFHELSIKKEGRNNFKLF